MIDISQNKLETQTKIDQDLPQIYVACLAAYNNGFLHGEWIDASEGIEHVRERIKWILLDSPMQEEKEPCEEWAIHDYQNFGNYKVTEYHDLEDLCEIAEFLKECENFPEEVVSWLVDDYGIRGARNKMDDDFIGEFDSTTDLAYHYVEETELLSGLNSCIENYFDYESFGRNLELNGDVISFSGYYFWNR